MSDIDYKKLLVRCMEQWIDSEGGCWNGDMDKTLTKEEQKVVEEIYETLMNEDDTRIEINELLEDQENN